ncbi:MAG: type IV secretion system protein [Wolbachia endosymbiont of Menacanthus eurysternus]|nr:MAG: type IV secretion system protein [Wolbachia endosymbiont of Menacanthus eurysternus]
MINKKSLLLVMYLIITNCNMDCIEAGIQKGNISVNINIPVHKSDEKIKIHWVDSGQTINKNEKIKFNLNGSINFCPNKNKNIKKVLVPATFCTDGSIPNYSRAANIDDVPDNYGIDEKKINENELCGSKGFGSNRRYVNTGIKVNPGDKLNFNLVPREIEINPNNLGKKISIDDNCYKTRIGNEKVLANEILNINDKKGKVFYCENKSGKRNKTEFFPLLDKKRKVLVGNGYTPYDNKIHFNKYFVQDDEPWINGALLDLRQTKIGLNELCDKKNCDFNKIKQYNSTLIGLEQLYNKKNYHNIINEIKKYDSYELNCYYQNICFTKEGIFNEHLHKKGIRNCISSIRYKKYDKKNFERCDMYSHLKTVENKLKKIKENENNSNTILMDEKNTDIIWAEALVAKIGNSDLIKNLEFDTKNDNIKSVQCLPKEKNTTGSYEQKKYDSSMLKCSKPSNNFEDFSLRLNHSYKVNENVLPNSDVMLAIANHGFYEFNKRGGYHVEVSRSCEYINGQKLYIYIGDNAPKDLNNIEANASFKPIRINEKDKSTNIISGEHLQDGESKKIYFGIDVSNIKKEDITDEKGKYYKNNGYNITLFINKKINNFVSSNINMIFDFTKKKIIEDNIKELHKGYAKGLLKSIRVLLTLYIIHTIVSYMLGTIQLSKLDFIIRIMKVTFITFSFSNKSWEFLGETLSKLFINSSIHLVDSFSGYIGEENKKFAFLDLTAGTLFTGETWLKFLSLIFAGPFGFIAFLIISHASFVFLKCIISAIFKYMISTILVAFLLSLTPLFTIFILFQQTKFLFDGWIKALAHIAVQPIILLSFLSILNQLMYSVLYNLTNFSVCYQCIISVNFLSHDFCFMKSMLPLGYSPNTDVSTVLNSNKTIGYFAELPIDLIQAIIYLIITKAIRVFVFTSETITQTIFNVGFAVANSISQVTYNASQALLSTVGLDDMTQGNKRSGIKGIIPHVRNITNNKN